jgi:hypothetical protein
MNTPQFKISGLERRNLKKELSQLKSYVKNFWHCHQLDKDMTSFYGGTDTYPMSDDSANIRYNKAIEDIENLENILSIPN